MSDLLSIGASGVRAYQTALTTVSDNIANVGTTGYSRRTVDLKEIPGSTQSINGRVTAGHGVSALTVSRSADAFKSAAVRSSGADLARTDTSVEWLDRIDGALTGNELSTRITSFFTAAKSLAADPTADTPRAVLLDAGASAAAGFTATGRALDQVSSDLDATAQQAVQTFDSLAANLAKVNDALGRSGPGTTTTAQLADQRDQILDQMSALSDINVTTDSIGRATVRLGGQTGPVLVAGVEGGHVGYSRNANGAVVFTVQRAGTVNIAQPSGGVLAGLADGAQRIADARQSLAAVAGDFVTGVNAVQAQGRDLDGNAGEPIFAVGSSPTEISVVLDDPSKIAAASVGGGTRDNSNIAALETARNAYGYETRVTALVTGNASVLAQRKTVADAQAAIHDSAVADLSNTIGVNLDNEAVDLLRFQQAYSASSRVIQTARDIFQSILDIR